jgi:hypothetical protein
LELLICFHGDTLTHRVRELVSTGRARVGASVYLLPRTNPP